jgi:hypothetical protein
VRGVFTATLSLTIREEQTMTPIKLSRFVSALQISVSALLVCGLQSYGQSLNTARTNVGTFVTFDVPGANLCTTPTSINSGGVITGGYAFSPFDVLHGFVRGRDGTIVTFDPQNTISGTFPVGINSQGEVTGNYSDASGFSHGFLRQNDGSILTFDPSGSVNTSPTAINEPGDITGWYFDSNLLAHGFLRAKDGTFTTFESPGSGTGRF